MSYNINNIEVKIAKIMENYNVSRLIIRPFGLYPDFGSDMGGGLGL
jgi:hypothetical protein